MVSLQKICEKRFKRTYFATKNNEGTSKTISKLIDLCNGDYIYIIASDDIAKPTAIETEVDFLNKNPEYSLVVGNEDFIDSNGKYCYLNKKNEVVYNKCNSCYGTFAENLAAKRNFNFEKQFGLYSELCYQNHVPNGFLIRAALLKEIKSGLTKAPLDDWYIMLQISKFAHLKYIDSVLFSYRLHNTNTIKNKNKMRFLTEKTRLFENQICLEILNSTEMQKKLLPNILTYIKDGVEYKNIGIKHFLEITSLIKMGLKYKKIKFFDVPVFEWQNH